MARTAALGTLAAIVFAWSWLRLERSELTWGVLFWIALVGIAPALPARRAHRAAAVGVAALLAIHHVYGTLRPRVVWDRMVDGFYRFYDIALPFSPAGQAKMHALVLLAIFGFTLAVTLAVSARRALLASALLVAGAVWPATLLTSSNTVGRGAVVLAAALAMLGGLSATARLRQAALAGAVVIAAAVGAAGIPAVAKGAFLGWETWEPTRADLPVSVSYVWETNYQTIEWPAKKTVVFTVEAPPTSRYWRATTLDDISSGYWLHGEQFVQFDPVVVGLLPPAAQDPDRQLEARFTIRALEDTRLLGASVPVRYDPGDLDGVFYDSNGNAAVPTGVPRGSEYTTWSYAPRPTPLRLTRSRPIYPPALTQYRIPDSAISAPPTPVFGAKNREARMEVLFEQNPRLNRYRPLYDRALAVTRDAPNPYAAVVALEAWFRSDEFTYDQSPDTDLSDGTPALTRFVVTARRGHCQHFAGAMALMLRYLGIPARVAAGFTSGSYDSDDGRWTVTDHDAHTWVEVWFRGFGWLPFDPTPGRGQLDGAYTTASLSFNAAALAAALAAGAGAGNFELGEQFTNPGGAGRGPSRDLPADFGEAGGGGVDDEASLLRLLALLAAGLLGAIALLKIAIRRLRYATRDPRRVAAACRRELADFLRDQRVDVPESATLAELGALVYEQTGVNADTFVSAADSARYGPPDEAPAAARRARRELRRIEKAFRRQLSALDRARGLVSLRSLGLGT